VTSKRRSFIPLIFINIFGGAFIQKENLHFKIEQTVIGGKFASQNRLGQLIVVREFMSVICTTFLQKPAVRT